MLHLTHVHIDASDLFARRLVDTSDMSRGNKQQEGQDKETKGG
jgi:hypothetical protein